MHDSETPTPNDRLDSWKEIAAYLRRDERTVRRWERSEGLPVHRHVHQKQSSVYAFRAELDAWRAARQPESRTVDDVAEETDTADATIVDDRSVAEPALRRGVIAGFAAAALIALAAATVYIGIRPASPPGRVMLAVLPFENMGPPEQDYFSDGLHEELITELARLNPDRLGVLARTTVLPYRDAPQDLRALGRELGVSYVLEGSVRREGDRARITAQLIAVEDGSHAWAEVFERELADVFSIQVDIARQVARHMAVELIPGSAAALTRAPTRNPDAYQAYLRGRYEWNRRTSEGLRRALDAFQQAIAIDPGYADAYSGLAGVYSLLGLYSVAPPKEVFPRARAAAARALELDPTLGDAWASLAFSKAFFDGDFEGAAKDFEKAIQADPIQATTYHWYALSEVALARFPEALTAIDKSRALEPLSAIISANRAFILTAAGKLDEAVTQCQTVLQLDADFHYAYWMLGLSRERQGHRDEAARALEKAIELSPGNPSYRASLAFVLARGGRKDEARAILQEILSASERTYIPPFYAALIYSGLGEKDRAFEWLDKAVTERSGSVRFLKIDTRFAGLKDDPRFVDLLRRLNLPLG